MRTTECQKEDKDSKAEPALSGVRPPVEEVSRALWLLAWVLPQGQDTLHRSSASALLPGQITRITAHFERAGTYPFLCHDYCGIAHHTMWGNVIVEPRS